MVLAGLGARATALASGAAQRSKGLGSSLMGFLGKMDPNYALGGFPSTGAAATAGLSAASAGRGLAFRNNPVMATVNDAVGYGDLAYFLGLPALAFAGERIRGVAGFGPRSQSALQGEQIALESRAIKGMASAARSQRLQQQKYEKLQSRMAESLARLAAASPQTYNQVMAGRQLPQGAQVFGGTPRVDLMEQLASRMALDPRSFSGNPAQPSVMDLI